MTAEAISKLSDRQIQEELFMSNQMQEKHLKYFSTVLTVYVVLTFIGAAIVIISMVG